MDLQSFIVLFLLVSVFQKDGQSVRTKRRLLDFRKMMKVFVRYNVKVNVLPYTSIIAFAMGFRGNWEIKPSTIIHPKRRISPTQQQYSPQQYNAYNQYLPYQYSQYQPQMYYQRAIHQTVQGAFDWHGLNGSACLQRTICEVSTIHHDDVISQIFKIVFNGTADFNCPEDLDCPVSLIQLVDHVLSNIESVSPS